MSPPSSSTWPTPLPGFKFGGFAQHWGPAIISSPGTIMQTLWATTSPETLINYIYTQQSCIITDVTIFSTPRINITLKNKLIKLVRNPFYDAVWSNLITCIYFYLWKFIFKFGPQLIFAEIKLHLWEKQTKLRFIKQDPNCPL